MTASKEKESRDASGTSLALLIKRHVAMASSCLLHPGLPVGVAGRVAVFLLWQVCCWDVGSIQILSPAPLSLLWVHLASPWTRPYAKLGSPGSWGWFMILAWLHINEAAGKRCIQQTVAVALYLLSLHAQLQDRLLYASGGWEHHFLILIQSFLFCGKASEMHLGKT